MPDIGIDCATRLRVARANVGMTQKEVSELTGINRELLSRYESGATEPSIQTLRKLRDVYHQSIDWMAGAR